ncbi:MAG: arylsulfotransferase family protein [Halolamina sp.]
MRRADLLRIFFAVIIVSSLVVIVGGYAAASGDRVAEGAVQSQAALPPGEREAVVGERNDTTVFSTAPRGSTSGVLLAYAGNGTVQYYNDTHTHYFDVDPVEGESDTVEYVAGKDLSSSECPATAPEGCTRIVVERANLSTGEVDRIMTRYSRHAVWHDVDRIDENHLLVGDIGRDTVRVVDTETGMTEWSWDAQSAIPLSEGGAFPSDWTHLNDVEYVGDGRVMASLRNQDQVVFVDMEEGLQEDWTLGEDGEYGTLYEQHNPDYIPEERGGPAILVADSENNRVVEYQREDGEWVQSWEWSDPRMQWPRDADRLPNGNTLITDSDGGRVIEVDREGEIVWSADVDTPYESERFGTGDESAGGESADRLELEPRTAAASGDEDVSIPERVRVFLKSVYPALVLNGLLFMMPPWVGPVELTAMLAIAVTSLAWLGLALWESGWRVAVSIRRG